MGTTVISSIVGLFCTIISSAVTFWWQKRKYNMEVDAQQIKNIEASFDVYKKVMEGNIAAQKEAMETIINSQNEKIETLQKENDTLKEKVNQLQMEMINILGSICLDATCKFRQTSINETPNTKKTTKKNLNK